MNKFHSLKKAHKIVIISVLAVLIVAAGTVTAFAIKAERERAAHAAAVEELKASFEIKINELDELEQSALALTLGAYLAEDITDEKINELNETFSSLTDIEVEEKYQEDVKEQSKKLTAVKNTVSVIIESVRTKFDTQTAINTLFTAPALVGDKVAENLVIADDLDTAKLNEVKKQLGINESTEVETPENTENSENKNEESSASEISEDANAADDIDEWGNTIHVLISEAETQVNKVNEIKTETAKYLADGVLIADVNRDIINNLKALVEQVKNETLKAELLDEAVKIELLYDEKIRVAAEEQAASVGGTAEKQGDGTYKVVASDNAEYAVSNTGEVTKTKDAPPPPAAGSSSGSGSSSSSGGSSAGSSGGSSGGSSSNSGSTGSGGSSGGGSITVEADRGGYVEPHRDSNHSSDEGKATWTGGSFDWPEEWG